MSSAAVFAAVSLISLHNGDEKGDEKAEQAEPGKQDVEKSQNQISKGNDPEVIIPFFLLLHGSATSILIMLAGHSLAHFPHPMHRALLTSAQMPFGTVIALLGQTLTQHPQATHSRALIVAFLFGINNLLLLMSECTGWPVI